VTRPHKFGGIFLYALGGMAGIIKPDLCIVGAGALGIGLAIKASRRGGSVVLVDRGEEPGDGPQARLAKAALLASAARAHAIRHAEKVGLVATEPKPNFHAISENAAACVASAAPRDSQERLEAVGITYLTGVPRFTDGATLNLGDGLIKAGQFVLAGGSRPAIPELPGLADVPFFTPDTLLENVRKLTHLVVIGGTPEALELAQAYCRLGSEVTLVPQGGLLTQFDPELVALLVRALGEEGLTIIEGVDVTAIQKRNQGIGVSIRHADGSEGKLDASHLLVASGRTAEIDGEWLAAARLKRARQHPERLALNGKGRSSNWRVSVIGGMAGEFTPHGAEHQGEIVLDRIFGGKGGQFDPLGVPRYVGTAPAMAQVGRLTPHNEARAGDEVVRASLAENEAALALASPFGSAKLLVDKKGAIVGGGVVGAGAGEAIASLAMAMERGLDAAGLSRLVLPHPSLAQVLVELGTTYLAGQPAKPRRLRRLLP
jgi:pyruvate/2-oxoglutarate dehydrogenase complex dihydrolipoamide dehydrogenase (E3) component